MDTVAGPFSQWKKQSWLPGKSGGAERQQWLPAWVHLCDTAQVMRYLCRFWIPESFRTATGLGEELERVACFLAQVHDIGKFTAGFLLKIARDSPPELRERWQAMGFETNFHGIDTRNAVHNLNGAEILKRCGCPKEFCAVVAAHHGKTDSVGTDIEIEVWPEVYYGRNGRDNALTPFWQTAWQEWYHFSLEEAGFGGEEHLPLLSMPAQLLLSGLLIMADWIASNTRYFPLLDADDNGETLDLARRAAAAWDTLDLPGPWLPYTAAMGDAEFEERFGFSPNAVQRAVMDTVGKAENLGILILEAQMGVGKTEAALCAAEVTAVKRGCGGLFFGLPTQATANGIFPRLKQWSEQQAEEMRLSLKLAHGMAALNEEYRELLFQPSGNVEVHPFFEGRKQALLANMVIGTVDQLLLMSLKQRHLMLRHLGMAGKVVVVDECHAYNAYINQYLDRALTWLGQYGIPVLLLSATLPAQRRSELVDAYLGGHRTVEGAWRAARGYPLLTWTDGARVEQKTITVDTPSRAVQITRIEETALPEILRERLAEGGCAGVIVNTVKRAQTLARQLRTALPDKRVFLFHAQFLQPDRAEKERELLELLGKHSTPEQRDGWIVVGTQVLEQSLDIDFDLLVTELCPMDLLLQRIGRLQRHFWRDFLRPEPLRRASCLVMGALGEWEGGAKTIYDEWLLYRTAKRLPETVSLPADIPDLVQDTYEPPQEQLDETEEAYWKAFEDRRAALETKASSFCIKKPKRRGTISGFMDFDLSDSEEVGQASVRDGDPSISVLVMVRYEEEDEIGFLPWQENGRRFPASHLPCEEDCLAIARQQLRLPVAFSRVYRIKTVIEELEHATANFAGAWQQSRWLKGELFLLLTPDLDTTLAGYRLHYDREIGLTFEKEACDGI